jgi:hypothetical protein
MWSGTTSRQFFAVSGIYNGGSGDDGQSGLAARQRGLYLTGVGSTVFTGTEWGTALHEYFMIWIHRD